MPAIAEYLKTMKSLGKIAILDGAIGSYLQETYSIREEFLWVTSANKILKENLADLHKSYIRAGANIITTNTFRTNPAAFLRAGKTERFEDYVFEACSIARTAVHNSEVFIAGSNPPAEDSYQKERTLSQSSLEDNHFKHITALWENGVDFILNETQSHFDEIKIICGFCSRQSIPFAISLYVDNSGKLLSGEEVAEVAEYINGFHPLFLAFNCISAQQLEKLVAELRLPEYWGFYLNCGSGSVTDEIIQCCVTPEEYSRVVSTFFTKMPVVIGACCGSGPEHIQELSRVLHEQGFH